MASQRDPYQVLQVSRSAPWPEIRAAYRALARLFHADGATPDVDRMVEINTAYARLECERQRDLEAASTGIAVGPGRPVEVTSVPPVPPMPPVLPMLPVAPRVPLSGSLLGRMMNAKHIDTPVVDFGQYAGWRIADIADHDPRYLRWLSRHSSGHRYRAIIEQVLGSDPEIGRRAAVVG